ncbi:hypothetical protein BH11PLA2_BH11PLA2_29460 [soil metagenome]
MRRRSKFLAISLLLAAIGIAAGVIGALLKQVPAFYKDEAAATSYLAQAERSSELMTRIQDLQNDIRTKPEWSAVFAAGDLNCFFQEMMSDPASGLTSFLPESCHSPRLAIEGDRIKLGLTYGHGTWSTVVWVELRCWLPKHDVNVMAVEIVGLNAGSLPISGQSFLESIADAAHESNVDVTWYRNDGNPVGLFRFYANQLRPATQIHTLKVAEGKVTLGGRTRLDSSTVRE